MKKNIRYITDGALIVAIYAIFLLVCRFFSNGLEESVYFILPIDLTVKKMIILCLCSPISAVAPVFSNRLGSRSPVPSAINSLSIIISIFIMTILILFMV